MTRAALNPRSGNKKTGPIITWETSSETCPPTCGAFRECYAKSNHSVKHWKMLDSGARGFEFSEFLARLEALPAGALARGNQWGDQPGMGEALHVSEFRALVSRAGRLRAWSYSHKPLTPEIVSEYRSACVLGYVVNVSADGLVDADAKASSGLPTVVILPTGAPEVLHTPAGRRVVVCPAQTGSVTCETCGSGRPLCYRADRNYLIGFRAHGQSAKRLSLKVIS